MSAERLHYLALLKEIHGYLLPRTYVEIGVAGGRSLAQAPPATLKVAIDPCLANRQPSSPSEKYFGLESDTFFEQNDLRTVLDGQAVDIAFIDGMHQFEFVLRDFMNLERFCSKRSVILVHDCNPYRREVAAREPPPNLHEVGWTGDVWKLIFCLKQYRPDLRVSVADSPPAGLAIVAGLDPGSSVLPRRYAEICGALLELDYSVLDSGKNEKLNVIPGSWDAVRPLLPSVTRSG
jgi:hypothetical protein